MSFVRAAVTAKLPPKQVIFTDPNHTEYDHWDLVLLKAYHFAQDFIRGGIPVWWDESDEVFFEVERRTSRSQAAIDRAERADSSGDKTPAPGQYYVPVPKTRGGQPLPSFSDWMEQENRKRRKD